MNLTYKQFYNTDPKRKRIKTDERNTRKTQKTLGYKQGEKNKHIKTNQKLIEFHPRVKRTLRHTVL